MQFFVVPANEWRKPAEPRYQAFAFFQHQGVVRRSASGHRGCTWEALAEVSAFALGVVRRSQEPAP